MQNDTSSTNTVLIVLLIIVVVGGMLWFFMVRGGGAPTPAPANDDSINVDVNLREDTNPEEGGEAEAEGSGGIDY